MRPQANRKVRGVEGGWLGKRGEEGVRGGEGVGWADGQASAKHKHGKLPPPAAEEQRGRVVFMTRAGRLPRTGSARTRWWMQKTPPDRLVWGQG